MASSPTTKMSFTRSLQMAVVSAPGRLTAMPSAMVAEAGVGGGASPFMASNIAG